MATGFALPSKVVPHALSVEIVMYLRGACLAYISRFLAWGMRGVDPSLSCLGMDRHEPRTRSAYIRFTIHATTGVFGSGRAGVSAY